jgi:hypothetical protein
MIQKAGRWLMIISLFSFFYGCSSNKSFTVVKLTPNGEKSTTTLSAEEKSRYGYEAIQEYNLDHADEQQEEYEILDSSLNKVAIVFIKDEVGKYALNSTQVVTSYFVHKQEDFLLKTFDVKENTLDAFATVLSQIRAEKFAYVLAIATSNSIQNLLETAGNNPDILFYIPTLNKERIYTQEFGQNVIFGGIDYKKQIEVLAPFASQKVSMFNIKNPLGEDLKHYVNEYNYNVVYAQEIASRENRFDKFLKRNSFLNASSLYLNTPIVKTSLLLSQLRVYEKRPYPIFSTQLGYNRLIFSLTQPQDRKNLIIANSIIKFDENIDETAKLLDVDIDFDWINYSTAIGIDYFYAHINHTPRIFQELIEDNQVSYGVELLKAGTYGFKKINTF